MYLYMSSLDCRLTGSLCLFKLFLGSLAVAASQRNTFVVGCAVAEEGGPNPCSGTTQSTA